MAFQMQQTVNAALLSMSRELDIPLVATNDVHYTLCGRCTGRMISCSASRPARSRNG